MRESGVYALLLGLPRERRIRIGRRDRLFPAGHYLYVGSAMNGLDARIDRHLSSSKKKRWHIDYLTERAPIRRVFRYPTRSRSAECRLSRLLASRDDTSPIAGFGATDCRCASHLYHLEAKPDFSPVELLRPTRIDRAVRKLARLYPQPHARKPRDAFRSLIACVISLRTKDEVTDLSARRLFHKARTPAEMAALRASKISRIIYPAGFYREKGRTIRRISGILLEDYGGRVPRTMEGLLSLPGVGRKTANLVLGRAFAEPSICVDTHVHRIMNRLGYVATDTPEETELALRRKLPKKYWISINGMLVRHGQRVCHPTSPRCSECVLLEDCFRDGVRRSR